MTNKYRSWCQNPIVTSTDRSSNYGIFKNFPNDVKVWHDVVVDVRQQKFFFFLQTVSQIEMTVYCITECCNAFFINSFISSKDSFEYVVTSYNCLFHSLITSDLSAFAGPRFLSVSLMTWTRFFSVTKVWSALFSFLHRLVVESNLTYFSTKSLIPSLSNQQNSSTSLKVYFETKWVLRWNCLFNW